MGKMIRVKKGPAQKSTVARQLWQLHWLRPWYVYVLTPTSEKKRISKESYSCLRYNYMPTFDIWIPRFRDFCWFRKVYRTNAYAKEIPSELCQNSKKNVTSFCLLFVILLGGPLCQRMARGPVERAHHSHWKFRANQVNILFGLKL